VDPVLDYLDTDDDGDTVSTLYETGHGMDEGSLDSDGDGAGDVEAGDSARDKVILDDGDIDNSNTGIPAAADYPVAFLQQIAS
jgi:hypothetical protein